MPAVELEVEGPPPYVSRGGVKLANALDALAVPVAGRRALDVGASTGGFTDCLLQRGAAARHRARRRLRRARLPPARGRARDGDRARERPRGHARPAPVRARSDRRRRLVHLADQGPARGARRRAPTVRLPRDGQAAVRGRARPDRQGRRRAGSRAAPRGGPGGRRRRAGGGHGQRAVGARGPVRQPRDVPVAGRGGAARRGRPRSRHGEARRRLHPPAPGGDRAGPCWS